MTISSRVVVRSVSLLLVSGFVALLAIVGTTIWLGERSRSHFEDVTQLRAIRGFAEEFRSAIQSAESAERGYLLTGNEIYLSPYDSARTRAQRRLAALDETVGDARGRTIIERLKANFADKFEEMDHIIDLKGERRDVEALAVLRTNRGKALMDEANLLVSGLISAADERLAAGVAEQGANASKLRAVSISAAVLIVLVVVGVVATIARYARETAQARDEVYATNASLESRVAERTAELERLNAEIQRFAHIVSHDLRAPLVNIVGFTGELALGLDTVRSALTGGAATGAVRDPAIEAARVAATVEMPEAIAFIRSSTQKMDGLIAAILMLSREGMRALKPSRVRIDRLLDATASAMRHQLNAAEATIAHDLEVETMITDSLALEHILTNLLENAVKYRAPGRKPRIEVRTRRVSPRQVELAIADNGRGIADTDLERIFELFRRAGPQDQPGEGIGLAYVQAIVRGLGGRIDVTSVLGQGTTFTLRLPELGPA